MSDEYEYVCDGKSCCLIPKYTLKPKNTKECLNYVICFNEIANESLQEYCDSCLRLPFEDKKLVLGCMNEASCKICGETKKNVKRNFCEYVLCLNCFNKIYFNKSLSKPVFPYLTENVDENDDLVIRYKKDLEYWEKFQVIDHSKYDLKE